MGCCGSKANQAAEFDDINDDKPVSQETLAKMRNNLGIKRRSVTAQEAIDHLVGQKGSAYADDRLVLRAKSVVEAPKKAVDAKTLGPSAATDNKKKKIFFYCYYYSYC